MKPIMPVLTVLQILCVYDKFNCNIWKWQLLATDIEATLWLIVSLDCTTTKVLVKIIYQFDNFFFKYLIPIHQE